MVVNAPSRPVPMAQEVVDEFEGEAAHDVDEQGVDGEGRAFERDAEQGPQERAEGAEEANVEVVHEQSFR